jgi:hypothetical protein
MITIQQAVHKLVTETPLMEDCLKKGLINYSAFARLYKKEIEEQLMKSVQNGAIIMALKRIAGNVKHREFAPNIFNKPPEMIVRSNLFEVTIKHIPTLSLMNLLGTLKSKQDNFLTLTEGVFETTIIASNELKNELLHKIPNELIISQIDNLSSITIKLPKENIVTPGIYYVLLKPLAWENINVIEVVSTTNENSIIFHEDDVDRAFVLLKNIFKAMKNKGNKEK